MQHQVPFPLLNSSIMLAGLKIRNRTVMAAMSSVLGTKDGEVTPELIAYYKARADGGVGMVTVEFSCVNSAFGRAEPRQLLIDDDCYIDGHRQLVEAICLTGARAAIQLHAPGQFAEKTSTNGLPAGPSAQYSRKDSSKQLCRELTSTEISGMVDSYAQAARRAVTAGYEAVEIHGAHGYLPMAFLSPLKNLRNDKWGGDEERRMRFSLEIIRAIKAEIGALRPLIYRLSSTDLLPGGLGLNDMGCIAPKLVEAGVDAIHVSTGTLDGTLDYAVDPMSMPEGWRFSHCRAIKAVVSVPVIGVGPARWPATAEKALANQDVDMIALGRPLLADPDWPKKAIVGDVAGIKPCTNCNWCFTRVIHHLPIGCAENPAAGAELTLPTIFPGQGQRVLVVGGGPAGMTAALDLDRAGYAVDLYETRNVLGGGLIASATPPLKEKLFWYLDFLKAQLVKSEVNVQLGTSVTTQMLFTEKPDAVVIASGARSKQFQMSGAKRKNVLSAYKLLMGESVMTFQQGTSVIVYGGGETGCETAEYLAAKGLQVILVTRSPARKLARSAEGMYRKHLLRRMNKNLAIEIRDNSEIVDITEEGARIRDQSGEHHIAASYIVLAQGRQSGSSLVNVLDNACIPYVVAGDVKTIARIGDAVHAARAAVRNISEQLSKPDIKMRSQ